MRCTRIKGMREQGDQKQQRWPLPEEPVAQENAGLSPSVSHEFWVFAKCILQQDQYYAIYRQGFPQLY